MKSTELRIGNKLYYKVHDKMDKRIEWMEENTIDAEDILYIFQAEQEGKESNYYPIPLQVPLHAFGFTNTPDKPGTWARTVQVGEKGEYECKLYDRSGQIHFQYIIGGQIMTKHIEFIHELQNIFFAITDQELIP